MFRPSINWVVLTAAWISMATIADAQSQDLLKRGAEGPKSRSGLAAMGDSLSSGFKKALKPFEALTTADPADPTRLATPAKPSAELHIAVARNHEDRGRFREAEIQYRKALRTAPNYLDGMLGYGQFLDRRGRLKEAIGLYHRAIKAHPGNARPLNHLGLCLASHGLLDEAVFMIEEAVRLEPKRAVYRNNLAAVLVEKGNNRAAFGHLRATCDEATAYYNLGYLLQKRGDSDAAIRHFAVALDRNPRFEEARTWLQHLQKTGPDMRPGVARVARRQGPRAGEQTSPVRERSPDQFTPPRGAERGVAPRFPQQDRSMLQQPTHATAPVARPNPLRFTSPLPEWSQGTRPSAESRGPEYPPTGPAAVSSPSGTRSTNVVYPLPPIEATPRHR